MNKGTLEGREEEITFVKKLNKKRDRQQQNHSLQLFYCNQEKLP